MKITVKEFVKVRDSINKMSFPEFEEELVEIKDILERIIYTYNSILHIDNLLLEKDKTQKNFVHLSEDITRFCKYCKFSFDKIDSSNKSVNLHEYNKDFQHILLLADKIKDDLQEIQKLEKSEMIFTKRLINKIKRRRWWGKIDDNTLYGTIQLLLNNLKSLALKLNRLQRGKEEVPFQKAVNYANSRYKSIRGKYEIRKIIEETFVKLPQFLDDLESDEKHLIIKEISFENYLVQSSILLTKIFNITKTINYFLRSKKVMTEKFKHEKLKLFENIEQLNSNTYFASNKEGALSLADESEGGLSLAGGGELSFAR